ncbi:MAG: MBL fold metallo-hydrolase [Deltaproteobacteria bacterium]|nr:MBL fold metallo-hydrolase [Deltaproteobacteria bacterium]
MKLSIKLWMFALVGIFVTSTALGETGLTRVSDSVYSYLDVQQTAPASSYGANAGIIIGKDGIAVIDTLVSAKEAERFLKDIKAITDKPIKYVINTHHHLDHVFGNSAFTKLGATVVAHNHCANEMRLKSVSRLTNSHIYGLTPDDMKGTEVAFPTITFSDRMRIDLGGVVIELIYVSPSHTKGGILVHLPAEKVVFAGDILFTDRHPYMVDGDIAGWQKTLDFLAALNADKVIAGHGPLSSNKDVKEMRSYITVFDKKAKELTAGNHDLEYIVTELKKSLPARSHGEHFIRINAEYKYMGKELPTANKT